MQSGASDPDAAVILARLREEAAALSESGAGAGAAGAAAVAVIEHEAGVLHEAAGEEPAAARDFLAAYNADAQFREPLEALVRMLSRRKSYKNLAKLLDAMAKGADTPEQRARALRELAIVALEHDKNADEARAKLEEAVAESPDDATAWLELELLGAAAGDLPAQMRAIEARVNLAGDATYKAMLYIQLAELAARLGQSARAFEFLDTAAALEGRARFESRNVLERVAGDDAEAVARALEGRGDLIAEAIDDPARAEEIGVPTYLRKAEHAADAWLRASEIRRRLGDVAGASALLGLAERRLPSSSVIARARIVTLEAQGDLETAAAIAKREIENGAQNENAAALWLRVAEASALSNDRAGAVLALANALAADDECIPARAIELDLLSDGQDPAALATSIEAMGAALNTKAATARAYLVAAYVWATLARNGERARANLAKATAFGISRPHAARYGRSLAVAAEDAEWFETATLDLIEASTGAESTAAHALWFELGRSYLLRGDRQKADEAFKKLAASEGTGIFTRSAWLGALVQLCAAHVLAAREETAHHGKPEPYDALAAAESDPELARAFAVIACLVASRAGDVDGAKQRLVALHRDVPGDELVARFLAELFAASEEYALAADALAGSANAAESDETKAALYFEAGLYAWRAEDRARAVEHLELARAALPESAGALLGWAKRGVDSRTLEGRRSALEAVIDASGASDVLSLERAMLEAAWLGGGGDRDRLSQSLGDVETAPSGDVALAAALARLIWFPAAPGDDLSPSGAAIDRLEVSGAVARRIARSEALRIARDVEGDLAAELSAAERWFEVEPTLAVGLEWLASSMTANDLDSEARARAAVASCLDGAAQSAMEASSKVVSLLDQPALVHPLLERDLPSAHLVNVELSPPGCDPRRRSQALYSLDDALGPDAELDAALLAAYADLAAGEETQALATFKKITEVRPDDIAAWEGVRAAALALDNVVDAALAGAQLGALCMNDERGATFWEGTGLMLLEHTDAHDDAEIALERAFERNPRADKAFDKLFRRVRGRKEDERLLELIGKRLEVADDEAEIAKLFWERARVLQKRGDSEGALAALENVTMLEPDHVGALALAGTICIQKGAFAEAAPIMARLSTIKDAPKQERLVSGVTACDLYENKLNEPEKALEVLVNLHREGLATAPVRERLARAAARTGAWNEATSMLEQLMHERTEASGRIEAARLNLAIWRDKVRDPMRAKAAVEKLLEEAPDDEEALDLVLATGFDAGFRSRALARGRQVLVDTLAREPADPERIALLGRIAHAQGDFTLRQATLGALVATTVRPDRSLSEELVAIDAKVPARPQLVLDAHALAEIADPEDRGPVAELFAVIAETVTLALGPSLESLRVTKKNRVDAKGGPPLRLAVAEWMGALGFDTEFELYVGGPDPQGVQGVAGEHPALVVGPEITLPLTPAARSALAREVFALRRGICALRTRDDAAVASCAIAACNEVGQSLPNPGYAVFGDISRSVHKEISRKVKKSAQDIAKRVVDSRQDPKAWAGAARRSIDRMAVVAAGDVSLVLADVLRAPRQDLAGLVRENERAKDLLRFVLSPSYLELRRKLGMGVR